MYATWQTMGEQLHALSQSPRTTQKQCGNLSVNEVHVEEVAMPHDDVEMWSKMREAVHRTK